MSGGRGIHSVFNAKDGDGVIRTREIINESVTLGTSSQTTTRQFIPSIGDLAEIELVITGSLTGTLSDADSVSNVLENISITDVNGKPIWEGVSGDALKTLEYATSGLGKYPSDPALTNSSQTVRFRVNLSVDKRYLPAKIQLTYAPYSSLDSGATGGSASVVVRAWYKNGITNTCYRTKVISKAVVSGTNTIAPYLPMNSHVNMLIIDGNESKLSKITLSRDGAEEIKEITLDDVKKEADKNRVSGYQTGVFLLPYTPFVVDDKTQFDYIASGSDTLDIYILSSD